MALRWSFWGGGGFGLRHHQAFAMKRLIIILSLATAVAVVSVLFLAEPIPPRSRTVTNMWVLKRRVLRFAHAHNELPESLTVLPVMDSYNNIVKDGWRRDIIFEVSTSGIVTFRSFGRDGVTGGSGEDADIVRSFPSRGPHGEWSDEMVQWSRDSFTR